MIFLKIKEFSVFLQLLPQNVYKPTLFFLPFTALIGRVESETRYCRMKNQETLRAQMDRFLRNFEGSKLR